MASKRHTPEQIVAKLRQVDVLTSQGATVADAVRRIGVTEVDHHRELAATLQQGAPARLVGLSSTCPRGVRACVCRVAGGASWISFAGHAPAGAQTRSQLTFSLDHQMGAGQLARSGRVTCRGCSARLLSVPPV